jgi:hypothetical protein
MPWLLTVAVSSIPMDVDVGPEPSEDVELILNIIYYDEPV